MNFHPPFSEPPSFFFFLIPQTLIGSNTLLQKFTPHFKILDPRLLGIDALCSILEFQDGHGHSAIWDNYSSNKLTLQITDNCKLQFALFALQLLAKVGFVDNQPFP